MPAKRRKAKWNELHTSDGKGLIEQSTLGFTSGTPRALRLLKPGVSLGELNRLTGISMPHLSRVFNRNRGMSLQCASKIAEALQVTMDDLMAALREVEASMDPRAA